MDISSAQASIDTGKGQSPEETTSEQVHDLVTGRPHIKPLGPKISDDTNDYVLEYVEPNVEKTQNFNYEEMSSTIENGNKSDICEPMGPVTDMAVNSLTEDIGSPPAIMAKDSLSDHMGSILKEATEDSDDGVLAYAYEDANKNNGELGSHPEIVTKISNTNPLGPPSEYATKESSIEQSGPSTEDLAKNKRISGKLSRRKHVVQSVRRSDRVLSSSQKKPETPEPSNNVADGSALKDKKRKKKRVRNVVADEFSRIRKNIRYLLHRMNYEQNFIDVYSGDGWKRLSVDKLKPEKELQRAASEILRFKRKIRDVFQRLDSICAEGKFPESLFDSDGQIDSEDIFCAKCGSKDFSAGNDIILCDGACDRGFHQSCLEPPLSMEEIPPDDEGWLCPGCDCKVDCIDMLNDSQGTTLSITKSWEKVFPEAADSECGNMQGDSLLSDDSEDDNYDPDASGAEEKSQEDNSSSDDTTFSSDKLGSPAAAADEQLLGLPSDDSEDDDYNPSAPDLHEQVNEEDSSSSSDFTSDSEDLNGALNDNVSSPLNHEKPVSDEMSPTSEIDPADIAPDSERRNVKRLDYKKLYDEAYPNSSSSSSDDDDWTDSFAPKKMKNIMGQASQVSLTGNVTHAKTKLSSKQRAGQKTNLESATSSAVKSQEGSTLSNTKSPYRRHGDAVNQTLFTYFKENQYPDRDAKEKMSQEVGMTIFQISKWFANARWSARHHPAGMSAKAVESTQNTQSPSPQNDKKALFHGEPKINGGDVNGVQIKDDKENKESSDQISKTPSSRKRKMTSIVSNEEAPKPTVDSPNGGQKSSKIKKTRRRSTS